MATTGVHVVFGFALVLISVCITHVIGIQVKVGNQMYDTARVNSVSENSRDIVNRHMLEVTDVPGYSHGRDLSISVKSIRDQMKNRTVSSCDPSEVYRRMDGSCNNLQHPMWGTPMRKLLRLLTSQYDDGMVKPRLFRGNGSPLPSARGISTACHPPDNRRTLDTDFSGMMMQWGQFLDHDITGTPEQNNTKNCCDGMNPNGTHPDYYTDGECHPILIGPNDRHFKTRCMEFRRSMPAENYQQREQMNIITAYMDASQIYGSSLLEMINVRAFRGGLLTSGRDDLLQLNTTIHRPCLLTDSGSCFYSGDVRVNEFPALTSMHTVFHREHNRLARGLAVVNPHWDDETLFQETRRILGAYMQVINYEEFLPLVMGRAGMRRYRLDTPYVYDHVVNPQILNSFATAAYRFGHSMIDRTFKTFKNPHQKIDDMYFRPSYNLGGNGQGLDDLMEGIITSPCQRNDRFFSVGVTDHLFKDFPKPGISFDLAARNIQRGRDHGLPPYIYYQRLARTHYIGGVYSNFPYVHAGDPGNTNQYLRYQWRASGGRVTHRRPVNNQQHRSYQGWSSGTGRWTARCRPGQPCYRAKRQVGGQARPASLSHECLRAYRNKYNDVDLFVGGLIEEHVDGGILGPTFASIIGTQFKRLKHSDRFWYETRTPGISFTPEQIASLRSTKLSRIICDNTNVPHIQHNVFLIPDSRNRMSACTSRYLPSLDLNLWREDPIPFSHGQYV